VLDYIVDLLRDQAVSFAWLEFMLETTVKCTIISGLALLFLQVNRKLSASARHLVLCIALFASILLPLFAFTLPDWNLSLLNINWDISAIISEEANTTAHISDTGSIDPAENSESFSGRITNNSTPGKIQYAVYRTKDFVSGIHWTSWLMSAWVLGLFVSAVIVLFKYLTVLKMVRRADPVVSERIFFLATKCRRIIGISPDVKILQNRHNDLPVSCGVLKPAVILPGNMEELTDKQVEIILLHEFAHIKRREGITSVMVIIASLLYWFNPVIRKAVGSVYVEREHACDDHVLTSGIKGSDYAKRLLELSRKLKTGKTQMQLAHPILQKSKLEDRIMAIFDNNKNRNTYNRRRIFFAALLSLILLIPVAAINTMANDNVQDIQQDKKGKTLIAINKVKDKIRTQTEIEEIKKTLAAFYKSIENNDIIDALDYFEGISDFSDDEKFKWPIYVMNTEIGYNMITGKDFNIVELATEIDKANVLVKADMIALFMNKIDLYATGDKQPYVIGIVGSKLTDIKIKSNIISVEKEGEKYVLTESIKITGLHSKKGEEVAVDNPEHKLSFVKENGLWKIANKKEFNIESKKSTMRKVGLSFWPDEIRCFVIQSTSVKTIKRGIPIKKIKRGIPIKKIK
jgi:beta-lactamase regulating signal transducer with metallopeptidase domain